MATAKTKAAPAAPKKAAAAAKKAAVAKPAAVANKPLVIKEVMGKTQLVAQLAATSGQEPKAQVVLQAWKQINPEDMALSSGPEEEISPMAAAMQRARQGTRGSALTSVTPPKPLKKQRQLNDALERTLQQLQQQKHG